MPRLKHWRKSDSKRRERSSTDESETTTRSAGSQSNVVAGSPSNVVAKHSISQETQRNCEISISSNKRLLILNILWQVIALTHRQILI